MLKRCAAGMGVNMGPVTAPPPTPTVLGAVNFSSAGPVAGRAGSLAATVQSSVGYTNNGGSFAMAQSVAMGGACARLVGYTMMALAVSGGACLFARGMDPRDA
ncbi:hypothetical protein BDZ94DRAFT_1267481 [Collybia nuda]|uniref:Uncharacterized protein n=1 Tax=Collybia nuda TaxID=64659 RepID=A0A9P5XXS2_9AGAR|nr:hypothetical protein BDZ94DRAFT_1267481 [Collybia nuda]